MINLETIFRNHFDSSKISDDKLKKFSEDHLARLIANNAASLFTDIIADTGAKHLAYFGAISNEDVATAIKEGMTVAVDSRLEGFRKLVQYREAAIRNAFDRDTPEYQEFFPRGLTEYSKVTKENAELLMQRLATATATHASEVGERVANEFQDMHSSFQALRSAQLGKKGAVGDLKAATAQNRDILELQLTGNIHFIGHAFPGNVQQCMAYFDQSFLRDAPEADTAVVPTP